MNPHNDLDDEDDVDALFASPGSGSAAQQNILAAKLTATSDRQRQRTQSETRDTRLRSELARIREINKIITDVTSSLQKARENMNTVDQTVRNASQLLSTWTRILSQTEHNQRLILNPNWNGATRDLENIENEEIQKQQDAERKLVEEQRRKEEAQRKAEEEEQRRQLASTAVSTRGARGRGGRFGTAASTARPPSSRGRIPTPGSTTTVAAQRGRGTTSTRAGSSIGRGTSVPRAGTRGRGAS